VTKPRDVSFFREDDAARPPRRASADEHGEHHMENNSTLHPSLDGPIGEAEAPSTPAPQRFDFEGEIEAYERSEKRWAFSKSVAKLTFDERVKAFDRRHEKWTRGQNLAESSDFRVEDERLDGIINAAVNVEVALGRHKALCELDFADYDIDDLEALGKHCKRFDRRTIVVRRVEGAVEYLDLARSDLILSLLLELRGWRKLARRIGREVRDQFNRTATTRARIAEHEYGIPDWCDERDESANDNASEHTDEPPAVTADGDNGVNVTN
jgi:hypothetical protein